MTKKIKHAFMACLVSKFAITICLLLIILDVFAECYFCSHITSILIGITTGLIATLAFYIYTRFTDSITSILEIQHITTLFLDESWEIINTEFTKELLLKNTKAYQYQISLISYKVVYKTDYYLLLQKISDYVEKLNENQNDYTAELTAIANARDQMLI